MGVVNMDLGNVVPSAAHERFHRQGRVRQLSGLLSLLPCQLVLQLEQHCILLLRSEERWMSWQPRAWSRRTCAGANGGAAAEKKVAVRRIMSGLQHLHEGASLSFSCLCAANRDGSRSRMAIDCRRWQQRWGWWMLRTRRLHSV